MYITNQFEGGNSEAPKASNGKQWKTKPKSSTSKSKSPSKIYYPKLKTNHFINSINKNHQSSTDCKPKTSHQY